MDIGRRLSIGACRPTGGGVRHVGYSALIFHFNLMACTVGYVALSTIEAKTL
jgi:hypothetical protein